MWVTLAWLALVLVHTPPALATFSPQMRKRMYGVDEAGPLALLLAHRGVLFLAVASVCVLAAFYPQARVAAALVTSISVVGFLIGYLLAKSPQRLRTIALVDALALVPLALVLLDALV
ncbi:MAG: hypothetical protein R3C30_10590 [Hyphomonadaceae bacterium]